MRTASRVIGVVDNEEVAQAAAAAVAGYLGRTAAVTEVLTLEGGGRIAVRWEVGAAVCDSLVRPLISVLNEFAIELSVRRDIELAV